MKFIAMMACAFALAGCASAEQLAAADDHKCRDYGFVRGDQGYANCRMKMDADRQQRRTAAANAIGDGIQNAADAYGRAATMPPARQPMNCTATPDGMGGATTNCY
jgi:hypothetical protein